MDNRKPTNDVNEEPIPLPPDTNAMEGKPTTVKAGRQFSQDIEDLKRFLNLNGGSILYCLSAVFVAYGIVKLMGPLLLEGKAFRDALPCIFALHAYELALLGVLILIVSKKVVDDAISVVLLTALFLVGTSIAAGSVADKYIAGSVWIGLASIALAFGKLYAMKRFAGIAFGILSLVGLLAIIACNYLGPALLAQSISVDPTHESARRGLWLFIWVGMLVGGALVLIQAMRERPSEQAEQGEKPAFLQSPVMVYVLALVVLCGSAAHQYSMAFTFALERVFGDFVPVSLVGMLLSLEILRHLGKRFGFIEIGISCVPLAAMMLAIEEKSVVASSEFGIGLICYPPVLLAICGLAIAAVALYHRRYALLGVAYLYGLGVVLTVGFSPENPYDLNMGVCVGTLAITTLAYGVIIRNQYVCVVGVIALCGGLSAWRGFEEFATSFGLTGFGSIAGVAGLCSVGLCLLFGRKLHQAIRIIGAICLAGALFDYLPEHTNWKYLVTVFVTVIILAWVWVRTKDLLFVSIILVPFFARVYVMARRIGYWRVVIFGFLLLAAGTIASLLKHPTRKQAGPERPKG